MKELQHNFQTKAHSLQALFDKVKKMSNFMRNLEGQAIIDPDRYDPIMYVGDGFEFFVELFLALHLCDNRVGVYNYTPIQENDNGVDGIGYNVLGEKCVVQIKYRANTQTQLTANIDQLSNMFSDGMLEHNVVADNKNPKNYKHFVFTTAEGLHFYTDQEMFKSRVRCFGFQDFRNLLDGNIVFWDKCREYAKELDNKYRK